MSLGTQLSVDEVTALDLPPLPAGYHWRVHDSKAKDGWPIFLQITTGTSGSSVVYGSSGRSRWKIHREAKKLWKQFLSIKKVELEWVER